MDAKGYIDELICKARAAQEKFEELSQEQIDNVVHEIARVVFVNAEKLARMAVDETKMGIYEDKVKKNQGKARIIWNHVKDKKTVGVINEIKEKGIVEIARPVGIVAAVTPCTNPIITPMCNVMYALKGRNAVIICPHPRAAGCAKYTVKLFNEAIKKYNVPENLIQILEAPSVEYTKELMSAADIVVATGGPGMVKSAYSSGKPSFGVGAGNVQCIIDRGMDIKEVIPKIIAGRIFDNGIICSGEQTVIAHEDDYDSIIEEFKANGAYYIDNPEEKTKLRDAVFPNGVMNKNLVGQSIQKLAEKADIKVPVGTKLILVKADGIGKEDYFSMEKMCPVIAAYKYSNFSEAIKIAQENLNVAGKGHSVSIHSNNKENIEYAACKLTVCRVLVNQICATMNGGSFYNGFTPTSTLGCGSWGNNSISENLDYKHFINITKIGYYLKDAKAPTDDELWGD